MRFLMPARFSHLISPMIQDYRKSCISVSGVLDGSDEPPAYESDKHVDSQKGGMA